MTKDAVDPDFRLTVDERSKLIPNIHVDALDRLLQHSSSVEERRSWLERFTRSEPGKSQWIQLVGVVGASPVVADLLEQILAPAWEVLGPEAESCR